jgi:hypothetical protein
MKFVFEFFKKIVNAKIHKEEITLDWYEQELLSTDLDKVDFALHAGLNMKTIENTYGGTARSVVLDASRNFYQELMHLINFIVQNNQDVDIKLTISLNDASVNLNIKESLIVINTLAVKRLQIQGGAWSSLGKPVI